MISYAQNLEDVILWRSFQHVSQGFYVDVGAFHPEIDSVTKWFYDQGWSGVNIEPVPDSFALLQAARPRDKNIRVAAGAAAATAQMTVFPNSMGLSSLNPTNAANAGLGEHLLVEVQVLPLSEVLAAYAGQDIHFLKIDAEGGEREVLLGMDFKHLRPWVVLVEATAPLTSIRTSGSWADILIQSDYQHVYFDGLNEFFLARERSELARHFKAPPNVFDNFELATLIRERQAREAAERSREEVRLDLSGQLAASQNVVLLLQAEKSALETEKSALQSEKLALQDQLQQTHMQLSSTQAAVDKLSSDVSELGQALKSARGQLDLVFKSRSWRWLAPIRKANFLLKSYRRKIRAGRSFL